MRAASCATRTASASWSATRRPSRTSRRATWSPARWPTRCARAAAAVLTGDYVYLDLTHLEPKHIDAKLPDITEFARTYLGVEPYTEPIPVFPTAHYAMGGDTDQHQGRGAVQQRRRRTRPVRRRRSRLRVRPWREPARHQLAARHQRLRPAGRHQRRRVRADRDVEELPDEPSAFVITGRVAAQLDRQRAGRGDPRRPAGHHGPQRPGLPHRGLAEQASSDIAALKARFATCRRAGQGQALQHRSARGRRAGLPARPGRGAGGQRWPATSRAAGTSARTTPLATT